jgi:hypothetical protein
MKYFKTSTCDDSLVFRMINLLEAYSSYFVEDMLAEGSFSQKIAYVLERNKHF